ncbi:GNAT family N-acetyltransferase [Sphingomonas colocasiae]|uniref:GNAT family N-acetyltransferase n=1 Tax=Sphingomonas colocasiae TaxID=1848973 RepID=A0ABS7PUI3_9SPHN|nr:GNAT family N-acetyltransferase [Sphingomonas colocasiae]MBY8825007.1 GNAT family N-acetyltransferase [Sphingomonas colocasiae]
MNGDPTVRMAGAGDAEAVAMLHARSWRSAYRGIYSDDFLDHSLDADRRRLWGERLGGGGFRVFMAEAGAALLGFAGFAPGADPDWGVLLDNFHVDPAAKGRGIGKLLFAAGARDVTARHPGAGLHLFVYAANQAACRVYDRLGGRVAERIDDPPGGIPGQAELRYHWPAAALRAIAG